jgi:hypothetical protein
MHNFSFLFSKTSKRHAQYMHDKEEAERHEMEQQIFIFMMNRSAKILQK